MESVKIGGVDMKDFGLVLIGKTISPPKAKLNLIEIEGRDGSLDLTDVNGEVNYEDRDISMKFEYIERRNKQTSVMSDISNFLHGRRLTIVFDNDKSFYYIGRISLDEFKSNYSTGSVVLSGIVEPYKYDIQCSDEKFEWDTLDFENGIINEFVDVEVNQSKTISLICRRKRDYLIVSTSDTMRVTHEGVTVQLKEGKNKVYSILLHEGNNEILFEGSGTVTVHYTGRSL